MSRHGVPVRSRSRHRACGQVPSSVSITCERRRVRVEALRWVVRHERATSRIKANASDAELQELCALAQKRSPVFDIVSNPVPVSVKLAR